MGAGVEFAGASGLVVFIFDRDFQFRGLDIDSFNGFTDDTSNGVKNLGSGLELTFFKCLVKEFSTHVLETCEHIFAISLPVFINEFFYFSPIAPSSVDRDLFFLFMVIDESASREAIKLTTIKASNAIFFGLIKASCIVCHEGYEPFFRY